MRALTTTLVAAALAAAPLAACHDDDANDGLGDPSAATASDLLASIALLDCQEAFSCSASYPGDSFADDYGGSINECVNDSVDGDDLATIDGDIADGVIGFDGDAATDCLNGIAYSDCVTYWDNGTELPDACDVVFIGTVVDGGACNVDFDCASVTAICDDLTSVCEEDDGFAAAKRHRAIRQLLRR